MPAVATYYQLVDNPTDVSASLTLSQSVPVTPAGGEGALVTWLASAVPGAGSAFVTYEVKVNGNKIGDYTAFDFSGSTLPTAGIPVQEATTTSDVKKGTNQLVFTKTGGPRALRLSAVILWHRVNV
jgi:hypothetical protein